MECDISCTIFTETGQPISVHTHVQINETAETLLTKTLQKLNTKALTSDEHSLMLKIMVSQAFKYYSTGSNEEKIVQLENGSYIECKTKLGADENGNQVVIERLVSYYRKEEDGQDDLLMYTRWYFFKNQ